jgi:uncharacterized protein involved in cysteine biosynthesis
MSKELIAILALTVTLITGLIGAVFSYGRLSERVDVQTIQIDGLTSEVKALNAHLIGYVQLHRDVPTSTPRGR